MRPLRLIGAVRRALGRDRYLVLVASVLLVLVASGTGQGQPSSASAGGAGPNVTVPCLLPLPGNGVPNPGVQPSGVAVPCPLLDIARFLPGGAQVDPDVLLTNAVIDQ